MECVVWAASKARVDTDEEESSDDDDEDAERNTPNDEGALLETEKEVLRNVQLTDLLADLRANPETKRTLQETITGTKSWMPMMTMRPHTR